EVPPATSRWPPIPASSAASVSMLGNTWSATTTLKRRLMMALVSLVRAAATTVPPSLCGNAGQRRPGPGRTCWQAGTSARRDDIRAEDEAIIHGHRDVPLDHQLTGCWRPCLAGSGL